jgi:hypothetical protein
MRGKNQDGRPVSIVRQKRCELQSDALSPSQHTRELIDHEQDVRQIILGRVRYAWWFRRYSNDLYHLLTLSLLNSR